MIACLIKTTNGGHMHVLQRGKKNICQEADPNTVLVLVYIVIYWHAGSSTLSFAGIVGYFAGEKLAKAEYSVLQDVFKAFHDSLYEQI